MARGRRQPALWRATRVGRLSHLPVRAGAAAPDGQQGQLAIAREVHRFAVTVPPGTLQAAPQLSNLSMPPRIVTQINVRVPPGPGGEVGFALAAAGRAIIPYEPGGFFVTDDESIEWPLEEQISSGAWQMLIYNTGQFPHTLEVRFLTDLPGLAAPAPVAAIPAGQLAPEGGALPELPPAPPFPVLPPEPPLPPAPELPPLPPLPPLPILPPPGGVPGPPATPVYHVTATAGLQVRSGPGSGYRSLALLPFRTPVTIVCQAVGERVNSSRVWDRISTPTAGYVSDWWIDTPVTGGFSPGLAVCR